MSRTSSGVFSHGPRKAVSVTSHGATYFRRCDFGRRNSASRCMFRRGAATWPNNCAQVPNLQSDSTKLTEVTSCSPKLEWDRTQLNWSHIRTHHRILTGGNVSKSSQFLHSHSPRQVYAMCQNLIPETTHVPVEGHITSYLRISRKGKNFGSNTHLGSRYCQWVEPFAAIVLAKRGQCHENGGNCNHVRRKTKHNVRVVRIVDNAPRIKTYSIAEGMRLKWLRRVVNAIAVKLRQIKLKLKQFV